MVFITKHILNNVELTIQCKEFICKKPYIPLFTTNYKSIFQVQLSTELLLNCTHFKQEKYPLILLKFNLK